MGHERGVLSQVTELRTKSQAAQGVAEKAKVEGAMGAALANLFAVAENYPDLKASQEFYGVAKIPGRHRGSGPAGPALLQRGRPELQHPDPSLFPATRRPRPSTSPRWNISRSRTPPNGPCPRCLFLKWAWQRAYLPITLGRGGPACPPSSRAHTRVRPYRNIAVAKRASCKSLFLVKLLKK